jgi:hypothetical protein
MKEAVPAGAASFISTLFHKLKGRPKEQPLFNNWFLLMKKK